MSKKLWSDERGIAQLLILVSGIALIAFLGISYFAPFRDQLLSVLHRKPESFAANNSNPTDTSYNLGVLVLKYFPLAANGQNIDIAVTGDVGDSYPAIKQKTADMTNNLMSLLPKATRYLGYKDAAAQPSLTYSIVDTKEYTQAVPIQPGSTNKPDLNKILNDHSICDLVDNQNVREVWLWAYQGPGPNLAISESQLTGPLMTFANGPYYTAPICKKTYRILTFNYQRGTSEAMHSWGHSIEFELNAVDVNLFKNLFQGPAYPPVMGVNGRCGSVHNPPNSRQEYDWDNPTPQKSDCLDWNPDGMGTLSDISCSTWGCQNISDSNNSSLSYFVWMWQNMPGRNNTKTYQGNKLRNWWDIRGDFDAVMGTERTLFVPSPLPTSTVVVRDTFDKVDNPSLGSTETGQTWESLKGSWGVISNTAYPTNGCPAPGYAVVDTGIADGVYEIKLPVNQQDLRIPFRVKDLNNLYWLETKGGNTYDLNRIVNGSQVSLAQLSGVNAQNGDLLKILLQGSKIKIFVNNILRSQITDSAVSGTKYGIGTWCNGSVRFDDFSFSKFDTASPIPTPTPSATIAPKIKIISPNGGETFNLGSTIPITWEANNRTAFALSWSYGPGSSNSITTINDPNARSYNWKIDVPNLAPGQSTQIKMSMLTYPQDGNHSDQSDNFFTIQNPLPPTPTPIPTVVPTPFVTPRPTPSLAPSISPRPTLTPSPSTKPAPTPRPTHQPSKSGDINGDGKITVADLRILLADFGKRGSNLRSDLNRDGRVDWDDIVILLHKLG